MRTNNAVFLAYLRDRGSLIRGKRLDGRPTRPLAARFPTRALTQSTRTRCSRKSVRTGRPQEKRAREEVVGVAAVAEMRRRIYISLVPTAPSTAAFGNYRGPKGRAIFQRVTITAFRPTCFRSGTAALISFPASFRGFLNDPETGEGLFKKK